MSKHKEKILYKNKNNNPLMSQPKLFMIRSKIYKINYRKFINSMFRLNRSINPLLNRTRKKLNRLINSNKTIKLKKHNKNYKHNSKSNTPIMINPLESTKP